MELAAFRARFPGIRPLIAYRSEVGDQTFHTLFGSRWRELYEFRLESDGRAYSRLLNPEQNLPFLRKEFEDKLQSFGSDNIYFRFRRPDGPAFESNGRRRHGRLRLVDRDRGRPPLPGHDAVAFRRFGHRGRALSA